MEVGKRLLLAELFGVLARLAKAFGDDDIEGIRRARYEAQAIRRVLKEGKDEHHVH